MKSSAGETLAYFIRAMPDVWCEIKATLNEHMLDYKE